MSHLLESLVYVQNIYLTKSPLKVPSLPASRRSGKEGCVTRQLSNDMVDKGTVLGMGNSNTGTRLNWEEGDRNSVPSLLSLPLREPSRLVQRAIPSLLDIAVVKPASLLDIAVVKPASPQPALPQPALPGVDLSSVTEEVLLNLPPLQLIPINQAAKDTAFKVPQVVPNDPRRHGKVVKEAEAIHASSVHSNTTAVDQSALSQTTSLTSSTKPMDQPVGIAQTATPLSSNDVLMQSNSQPKKPAPRVPTALSSRDLLPLPGAIDLFSHKDVKATKTKSSGNKTGENDKERFVSSFVGYQDSEVLTLSFGCTF